MPETLLPLTASAAEMRKREQEKKSGNYRVYISDSSSIERLEPGHVFSEHHVIGAVTQMFNYGIRSR
jgi:hypothetical protein